MVFGPNNALYGSTAYWSEYVLHNFSGSEGKRPLAV